MIRWRPWAATLLKSSSFLLQPAQCDPWCKLLLPASHPCLPPPTSSPACVGHCRRRTNQGAAPSVSQAAVAAALGLVVARRKGLGAVQLLPASSKEESAPRRGRSSRTGSHLALLWAGWDKAKPKPCEGTEASWDLSTGKLVAGGVCGCHLGLLSPVWPKPSFDLLLCASGGHCWRSCGDLGIQAGIPACSRGFPGCSPGLGVH